MLLVMSQYHGLVFPLLLDVTQKFSMQAYNHRREQVGEVIGEIVMYKLISYVLWLMVPIYRP
jgi:hypothetical protein